MLFKSEWGASLTTASIPINEIVMPQHTFPSAKSFTLRQSAEEMAFMPVINPRNFAPTTSTE
ncbi:MAG: hypothetical protein CM15mP74_21120 [Halieaceae bacterium]|nr:MAG: hypothetical protein CM15mP74_21120 [Halieaceae bacterium]